MLPFKWIETGSNSNTFPVSILLHLQASCWNGKHLNGQTLSTYTITISLLSPIFLCETEPKRWQIAVNEMNGNAICIHFSWSKSPSFPSLCCPSEGSLAASENPWARHYIWITQLKPHASVYSQCDNAKPLFIYRVHHFSLNLIDSD